MALWKTAVLGLALAVGGCSFTSETLLPTLTGEPPPATTAKSETTTLPSSQAAGQPGQTGQVAAQPLPPPAMGTSEYRPVSIEAGKPTGTAVGQKVVELRRQLEQLQSSVSQHASQLQAARDDTAQSSEQYYRLIAGINAKLQVGTTPGNPILVGQWNQAQAALEKIDANVSTLNGLSTAVANDSSVAAYILESTRATYGLSGAVDEDHRQLGILEDEVNKTVVNIDRLLNELSDDISRQTLYIARERSNLNTLSVAIKNGELLGSSLVNRAYGPLGPLAAAGRGAEGAMADLRSRRPLVVIRFDRRQVDYEQALYTAVSRALERKPSAEFDLVAVAPSSGSTAQVALASNQARKNADAVMRSLINMGLPASRIGLSATTSRTAETNEVLVYAR